MSLDIAVNFVRGAISAVGNIAATTLTYTLAGPNIRLTRKTRAK